MICSLCMRRIWFGQRTVALGGQARAHVACDQRQRERSAREWEALRARRHAYERAGAQPDVPSPLDPFVQATWGGVSAPEREPERYAPSDYASSADAGGYSGGGGDFGGGGASGDYGGGTSGSGGND